MPVVCLGKRQMGSPDLDLNPLLGKKLLDLCGDRGVLAAKEFGGG
jgi:hypothetical protein